MAGARQVEIEGVAGAAGSSPSFWAFWGLPMKASRSVSLTITPKTYNTLELPWPLGVQAQGHGVVFSRIVGATPSLPTGVCDPSPGRGHVGTGSGGAPPSFPQGV